MADNVRSDKFRHACRKRHPLPRKGNRPLAICLGGIRDGDLLPANPDPAFLPRGYAYFTFRHGDGSILNAYVADGLTTEQAADVLGEWFAREGGVELVEKLLRRPGA